MGTVPSKNGCHGAKGRFNFQLYCKRQWGTTGTQGTGNGVKVTRYNEDDAPFKQVYDPEHPDANDEGYVQMPNVDPLREMVDLMSATRSYEANVTVFNASKSMLMKALEIGK